MQGDNSSCTQRTLDALRQTSKGKLNYRHVVEVDSTEHHDEDSHYLSRDQPDRRPSLNSSGHSSERCLNVADVQSILKEDLIAPVGHRSLLTVNDVSDDEEESQPVSTQKYFLDVDNSCISSASVSAIYDSDSVTEPVHQRTQPRGDKTQLVIEQTQPGGDKSLPGGERSPVKSVDRTGTPMHFTSPEESALKEMKKNDDRDMQERISKKQLEVLEGFEAINRDFNQRFQELLITQEMDQMTKEEQWEEEMEESQRIYKAREEDLRRWSLQSGQVLNISLEKVKETQRKEAEKRLIAERKEEHRQLKEKERIASESQALLAKIEDSERALLEALNTDMFNNFTPAQSFVQKGRSLCKQIMEKVESLTTNLTNSSLRKLQECLNALHTLTDSVHNQRKSIEHQYKRQLEVDKQQQQERQQQERQQQERQQQQQEQYQQKIEADKQRQHEQLIQAQRQQGQQSVWNQQQQNQLQLAQQSQQQQNQVQHQPQQPGARLEPRPLTDMCCHEDTFKEAIRLNNIVREAQEVGKRLSSNPQTKKLRIELQKAVSITVNAISSQSTSHTKEKLRVLTSLINGESVSVGNSRVTTNNQPDAILLCKNLIAKKLVEQAESQVSANVKAAIPFAEVMVSLMNKSPDMKDLILGYFYIQCPYLVPYYPPHQPDQSTEEYWSSLGYKISSSGDIETQDLFTKRISGLAKLFASCLVSRAVGGSENTSLNIEHGWLLLVRIVNLKPSRVTTATVLGSLLSVCGTRLVQVYGRQGRKLLAFILRQFVPAIRDISNEDTDGGATEKLELVLSKLGPM